MNFFDRLKWLLFGVKEVEDVIYFGKCRNVKTPTRGTEFSAGLDFFVPETFETTIVDPGKRILIPSGIKVNLIGSHFEDHALIFFNKSGVASKQGMLVGACVVDADYQGEVHLNLFNCSDEPVTISGGMKLTQALLLPVVYAKMIELPVDHLFEEETTRGAGGFGSTGSK